MQKKIISVIGGTGFLGRYVVNSLLRNGFVVQVISRFPEDCLFLKTAASVGQISLVKADITSIESLKKAIKNSYAVINLAGIISNSGKQNFDKIHVKGAINVAKAAIANNVTKLVHVSALGVDKDQNSNYAKSKLKAENLIRETFPSVIIIRPSLIFGTEDNFFNKFARMTNYTFALPLIGWGKPKFQPVYVVDVANAIAKIVKSSKNDHKIYELVGPKIYSFRELLEFILKTLNKQRDLIPLPFFMAKIMALFLGLLPNSPLTLDQVRMLETDNISDNQKSVASFKDLAIVPSKMEAIVPNYIMRYR